MGRQRGEEEISIRESWLFILAKGVALKALPVERTIRPGTMLASELEGIKDVRGLVMDFPNLRRRI